MNRELYRILTGYDFSQPAVLCSLVHWEGSVPRKDYPRMLVTAEGRTIGTIGGGSVEHNALETAHELLKSRQTKLLTVDLRNPAANQAGGLCGGLAYVLVEPFTRDQAAFLKSLKLYTRPAPAHMSVTVIEKASSLVSRRLLPENTPTDNDLPPAIAGTILRARQKNHSVSTASGTTVILVEPPAIEPVLHIFGAGHVGQAVADLAHFIELEVQVYDDRRDLATPERFPHASQIHTDILTPETAAGMITSGDYILVATRSHHQDLHQLRHLLPLDYAWLGVMSSRRKWKILSQTLRAEGFPETKIDQIHAPVGLNIGSETVPEIAISIIAEIVQQRRQNKFLKSEW